MLEQLLWAIWIGTPLKFMQSQRAISCWHSDHFRVFPSWKVIWRAWKVSWHKHEHFEKLTWRSKLLDIGQGHGHVTLDADLSTFGYWYGLCSVALEKAFLKLNGDTLREVSVKVQVCSKSICLQMWKYNDVRSAAEQQRSVPCSAAQVKLVSPWEVEKPAEKLTVSSRPSPEGLAKRLCLSAERLSSWAVSCGRNWQCFPGKAPFLQTAIPLLLTGPSARRHPLSWSWQTSLLSAEFSPDSASLSAVFALFIMKKKRKWKKLFLFNEISCMRSENLKLFHWSFLFCFIT